MDPTTNGDAPIYDDFFMINGFSGYSQYIVIYLMLYLYFQISSQMPGVGTVPSEKVPLWLFVIRSFLALVPREDWTKLGLVEMGKAKDPSLEHVLYIAVVLQLTLQFISFHIISFHIFT